MHRTLLGQACVFQKKKEVSKTVSCNNDKNENVVFQIKYCSFKRCLPKKKINIKLYITLIMSYPLHFPLYLFVVLWHVSSSPCFVGPVSPRSQTFLPLSPESGSPLLKAKPFLHYPLLFSLTSLELSF